MPPPRYPQVLELLYDGTPASLQRPATLDHLDVAPQSAALTATPGAPPPPPLDAAALKELLDGCCYSEEYQDPAAMQARYGKFFSVCVGNKWQDRAMLLQSAPGWCCHASIRVMDE